MNTAVVAALATTPCPREVDGPRTAVDPAEFVLRTALPAEVHLEYLFTPTATHELCSQRLRSAAGASNARQRPLKPEVGRSGARPRPLEALVLCHEIGDIAPYKVTEQAGLVQSHGNSGIEVQTVADAAARW